MDAVTAKIIGYLLLVGGVCIAWAATKVSANAGNGDVKKGANSGIVTFIAIFLFAAASGMVVIAGFMTGLINDLFA
jgi:hypothetical protein